MRGNHTTQSLFGCLADWMDPSNVCCLETSIEDSVVDFTVYVKRGGKIT